MSKCRFEVIANVASCLHRQRLILSLLLMEFVETQLYSGWLLSADSLIRIFIHSLDDVNNCYCYFITHSQIGVAVYCLPVFGCRKLLFRSSLFFTAAWYSSLSCSRASRIDVLRRYGISALLLYVYKFLYQKVVSLIP